MLSYAHNVLKPDPKRAGKFVLPKGRLTAEQRGELEQVYAAMVRSAAPLHPKEIAKRVRQLLLSRAGAPREEDDRQMLVELFVDELRDIPAFATVRAFQSRHGKPDRPVNEKRFMPSPVEIRDIAIALALDFHRDFRRLREVVESGEFVQAEKRTEEEKQRADEIIRRERQLWAREAADEERAAKEKRERDRAKTREYDKLVWARIIHSVEAHMVEAFGADNGHRQFQFFASNVSWIGFGTLLTPCLELRAKSKQLAEAFQAAGYTDALLSFARNQRPLLRSVHWTHEKEEDS